MTETMRARPAAGVRSAVSRWALPVALLVALTGPAAAQPGFRVTYKVGATNGTHVEVTGSVQNEARADAVDVSVTVEALGAGGKVVARGITFVTPRLAERSSATFVARIPAVAGVTGYRASVSSYRFIQSVQGP
jgi:hypothetical protein